MPFSPFQQLNTHFLSQDSKQAKRQTLSWQALLRLRAEEQGFRAVDISKAYDPKRNESVFGQFHTADGKWVQLVIYQGKPVLNLIDMVNRRSTHLQLHSNKIPPGQPIPRSLLEKLFLGLREVIPNALPAYPTQAPLPYDPLPGSMEHHL